jgi:hypothetical protein
MAHYKLHTNEGAAWCGAHTLSAAGSKGVSGDNVATQTRANVTCPDCLKALRLFDAQMAEAKATRGKGHTEFRM